MELELMVVKQLMIYVKFRIAAIDNNNPGSAVYMHFRAFLDSMDDSYTCYLECC